MMIAGVSSAGSAAMKVTPEHPPAERLVAAHVVAARAVIDVSHHEDGHHGAGNDAAEEQRADRDVPHHAVDDERQRRRDDRPERRGRGGDADREFGRVAVILHRLDLDRAETGRIRDRGARHAGEDHRADDVDVREPAAHPARERDREIVDAVGDAGRVHQIAGQDEERHREQRETVDAARHAVQDHEVRIAGDEMRVDERRAGERDEHRHAGEQHRDEDERHHDHDRVLSPREIWCVMSSGLRQPARALRQTLIACRMNIRKQPKPTPA